MARLFDLKVLTPQGTALKTRVRHLRFPASDGLVGVLAAHAPYLSSSPGGTLSLDLEDGTKKDFHIGPGFFTILEDQALLLTDTWSEGSGN